MSGRYRRIERFTWIAASLLLGEFLWLVSRYTTATLPDSHEPWVQIMDRSNWLPRIGLAVATMILLFRGVSGHEEASHSPAERPPALRRAWMLVPQLGAFLLFERMTARIFVENLAGSANPVLYLGLWFAVGLGVALLGVLLFVSLRTLLEFAARRAGALSAAALLGLAAWGAGMFAAIDLSMQLRVPTLWLCDKLLWLCGGGYPIDAAKFIISTPNPAWSVRIAPECSGFEGIGLMAVSSVCYLWLFRGRLRFPQSLLLPFLGIVGIYVLNVFRIVALVLIGTHLSLAVAVGGFHSLAGTIAFCIAMLGLVLISLRMRFFSLAQASEGEGERDGTAAYLLPFLFAIAIGMVASAFDEWAQALGILRVLGPGLLLWYFRRRYAIDRQGDWLPGIAIGLVACGLWLGITQTIPLRSVFPEGSAQSAGSGSGPVGIWLAIRIVGNLAIVPVFEELAFRGYLMRRLTTPHFEGIGGRQASVLAWGISSLLFGVLHGHWVAATVAGALFGFAYKRRGRLFDAILAHGVANALIVLYAALTNDWSLV